MKTINHLLVMFFILLIAAAAEAKPFGNIDNTPFASRCNGPQGAITVPFTGGGVSTSAVVQRQKRVTALRTAVKTQHATVGLRHPAKTFEKLRKAGLVDSEATLRLPRLVVETQNNQPVLPDLISTAATEIGNAANQLTFEFVDWSAADQSALQSYLNVAYPKARLMYGPPAFANNVKIIRDDTITDIQGGVYDATNNEIRIPSLSGNFPEDTFVLLMLVLRAFHDDVAFYYDAWEEGFVGAAATAIQVQPGVSPGFDPKDPGPFYALSVYEAENHPALGNSTFYPEGGFTGMTVWRIAMARAAWLKCWIEDETFFARFNQRYYAEYVSGLQGDVPALREIATQVLPTVEAMPFQDWFQRQYVLDTSVHSGLKEYTWNVPVLFTISGGDTIHAVVLIVEHYQTDTAGNEAPRSGTARTIYWSHDFSISLYAEEGNLISISDAGDTPGEGSLIPTFFNIGGAQRITVQMDLNGLRSLYVYPYGVRGFDPGENNLYGAIVNQGTGTLDAVGGDGITALAVKRGVWGKRITTSDLTPMKVQVSFTNPSGQTITRQINVGWDSYLIILDGGAQSPFTQTFLNINAGLHFMSLPFTPLNPSAPEMLGISTSDLLLARWDPTLPLDGGYGIWPQCQPFALGRGYWLRVLKDVNIVTTGIVPAVGERVTVPVYLGWNMIGAVRTASMPLADVKVQIGTETPVLMAEAISKRYIQNGIFEWDALAGYRLATDIVPWKAYWVRALNRSGARLLFDPISTSTAKVATAQPVNSTSALSWKIPLRVDCGPLYSEAAWLGGAKSATTGTDTLFDIATPPDFEQRVTARFLRNENGSEVRWLSDVRPVAAAGQVWQLEVESTLQKQPVRLSWPDLSSLPASLQPCLVDSTTGMRIPMRTVRQYVMTEANTYVKRHLRIEMAQVGGAAVKLKSMNVIQGNGQSLINFSLNREAVAQVTIYNFRGVVVRRLAVDATCRAGSNLFTWNQRDELGSKVAAANYLVEVKVQAVNGSTDSVTRIVNIKR